MADLPLNPGEAKNIGEAWQRMIDAGVNPRDILLLSSEPVAEVSALGVEVRVSPWVPPGKAYLMSMGHYPPKSPPSRFADEEFFIFTKRLFPRVCPEEESNLHAPKGNGF